MPSSSSSASSSSNAALYLACVLIWGSTWFAIEFQLGVVDPAVSVAYRFALAGGILLAWLAVRRQTLLPPPGAWPMIGLTGVFTFSLNYLFVYLATGHLPSGLVAVAGSALSLMNVLNSSLFLGQKLRPTVLVGGATGVAGVLLLFAPEVDDHGLGGSAMMGFLLVMVGNYCASLGNMAVARARKANVPLVAATAWGMVIGAAIMAVTAMVRGVPFTIDPRPEYWMSLLFLALFGSVTAFLSYFTLLGRIGPDRAGYTAVMVPIVALVISTLLEGYRWTAVGAVGLLLAVGGNLLVMAPTAFLFRRAD